MTRHSILTTAATLSVAAVAFSQNTPLSQMEKLDRGVVVVPTDDGKGHFMSWRFLGIDDELTTTFDVLRNGRVVKRNLYQTYFTDTSTSTVATYQVVTKVNGEPTDTSRAVTAWPQRYLTLQLQRPATGAQGGTYSPNDCSVGDVDGDGRYEIFVKWDPSNAKDNSQSGITDNVFIDCYQLAEGELAENCRLLWRIDLGRNIRAGAHYTQFMVYDFDGDGRAELMCKTGPGSIDGKGNYVNQAATLSSIKNVSGTALYRSDAGRITGGQEWLTVFSGLTGEAVHTIFYNPNRNMTYGGAADGSVNWGVGGKNDTGSYGNRGERYLAAVAHLDGPEGRPSGIFCRGYYDYAFIWAVDFDGEQLHQRWLSSNKEGSQYQVTTYDADGKGTSKTYSNMKPTSGGGSGTMYQNGNHNLSIADVDGDGRDEIVWGSAACDDDGRVLYGTGFGHGDAIHLADHCPDRPGLEVFQVHENKGTYAWDLHDAATGEVLLKGGPSGVDNGRGMAAQFDANVRGSLFWSASDRVARSAVDGNQVAANTGSMNFRIFWDGDLQEELLDGGTIDKWNGNGTTRLFTPWNFGPSSTCNGSKNTPNLLADLLGDWREELILHNGTDQLAVYTTNIATPYRMPTLMHDHTYRMGICWQNTAYNQPPHLGYYLPDAMLPHFDNEERYAISAVAGQPVDFQCHAVYTTGIIVAGCQMPDGTKKSYSLPEGLTQHFDKDTKAWTLTGTLAEEGTYKLMMQLTGVNKEKAVDTLIVNVSRESSDIENIKVEPARRQKAAAAACDLLGRRVDARPLRSKKRVVVGKGYKAIE